MAWAELPLERYALGLDRAAADGPSFCQLLEFGTPKLGSIKGGSAAKHIMYRHHSGEWRLAAPLQQAGTHQAAWERLRSQFTAAFDAAGRGDFDALDDLELLQYGPALVTKALAVYFPEHFLRIYSAAHLRRFIELLGGVPQRNMPAWQANRLLRDLVLKHPAFEDWSMDEVATFLYESFDPRPRQRTVWKIAPGDKARLWQDCLDGGFICVGWDGTGDLTQYEGEEDLRAELDRLPDAKPRGSLLAARRLLDFRDLEPGDVVIANRGKSEVLGLGTVTDGYRFDPGRSEYRHLVSVEWDVSYAQRLAREQPWQSTFAKVSRPLLKEIRAGRPRAAGAQTGPAPEPTAAELPDEVRQVLDALHRKGQVILHGPPGTGKTRLALSVALALAGQAEAIDAAPAERDSAMRGLHDDSSIKLVTFHPSYGYEDFVEGFKPDPDASGTGLSLKPTDGVFHRLCAAAEKDPERTFLLIIDEINRGDLPRIFGELITLLELDKRSLTVDLPITGRRFSVPPNIRIIGTMNTADRSISHLDAAVRRRFAFLRVAPDPDAVSGLVGPLNLGTFFSELNTRITRHLDADHQLGHAYFLRGGGPVATEEELEAVLHHDVVPLLEDHCLGRADLLQRILGRLVDETGQPHRIPSKDFLTTLVAEFPEASAGADE
ncbi:5-methylcytosine-specific restriction enzyme subunit McrB [Kitasatospora sp. MMS16-BH015]|nr:5-methylcytosine-specific restriction enzyme subunit McrB [Kitasatospora sp. MMS16-BH015]